MFKNLYGFLINHEELFQLSIRFFKDLTIKIEEDYTKYLNLSNSKWIDEEDKDEFYNKISNANSI